MAEEQFLAMLRFEEEQRGKLAELTDSPAGVGHVQRDAVTVQVTD